MDKGYYQDLDNNARWRSRVAIHNKNGQGLLRTEYVRYINETITVAIHNKNGQGLLLNRSFSNEVPLVMRRNPQ